MSLQTIFGYLFLASGVVWAALLFKKLLTDKRPDEGGKPLSTMLITEGIVYFIATMGISDFLMNTIMFNRYKSEDTSRLPGTLMLSAMVPGSFMAYTYLKGSQPLQAVTLLTCTFGMLAGALIGGKLVENLDGAKIKKILGIALIFSMGALIAKMILSAGASGTAAGIGGIRLVIAAVCSFACGALNMVGVPAKPTLTALFLLLGLSPVCTLTLVLVMCGLTPIGAGIRFYSNGMYHRKTVLASLTAGTVTAVLGCMLMISLPALVLNILLLGVMLIAIITTFKK
ncbi:MAG: hypothetical protein HUJ80_03015 [Firmicutes bacterium]|nr:hypothetical protein [Bacillota bacterium]